MTSSTNASPTYVAIVDDDESLCRSLSRLLRAGGIHPVSYESAEAFLADTKHQQFDCLVLDIRLGGMSGIELARQLAADDRSTPFIFITAQADEDTRAEAEAVGCSGFFRKTDSGTEILSTIRRLTR